MAITIKTLFNQPLAHTNDPQTSFDAAQKAVDKGLVQSQCLMIEVAIRRYFDTTDFTGKELSKISDLDYYTIYKRLSILKNRGLIEETPYERDGCKVLRLVKQD